MQAASYINTAIQHNIVDLSEEECSDVLMNILISPKVPGIVKKVLDRGISTILDIACRELIERWKDFAIDLLTKPAIADENRGQN